MPAWSACSRCSPSYTTRPMATCLIAAAGRRQYRWVGAVHVGRGGLSRVATRVCGRAVLTSEGGAALQRARRPPAARPHPSPPLPTLCFFIFSVQGGITFQTRACPSTLPLSSRAVPIHRPAGGGAPAPAGAAAALPHPRVKSRAHRSWRPRHPAHALQGPSVIHVRLPLPLPRLESCNQPPSDPPIAFIAPPLPPPPPPPHTHTTTTTPSHPTTTTTPTPTQRRSPCCPLRPPTPPATTGSSRSFASTISGQTCECTWRVPQRQCTLVTEGRACV